MLLPLLLSACLLPSLPSADEMQCLNCASATHEKCIGNVVPCSKSDNACVAYYEKVTVGVKETTLFLMMCGTCKMFQPTTVRFHKGTVKSNSTCCMRSNCIPPEPVIAPDRPAPKDDKSKDKIKFNGVNCKSCYANAKSCDCTSYVNCTGKETICIHRYTILSGEYKYSMAVRGCTTNHTCQTPILKNVKAKSFTVASDYTCSNGQCLRHTLLPLTLSSIFLFFFRPVLR
ncbi:uncharacterized protein ACMZJ9_019207 [Mantella aurantiaca]